MGNIDWNGGGCILNYEMATSMNGLVANVEFRIISDASSLIPPIS